MIKKSVSLTAEGKKELEEELDELIKNRPAVAERIATARAFGDLSENEEYSSARNEQKVAEERILEIQVNCEFLEERRSHNDLYIWRG